MIPRKPLIAVSITSLVLAFSIADDTDAFAYSSPSVKGNTRLDSFAETKQILERQVFHDMRQTFYCRAKYDSKKNVTIPAGFRTPSHEKRARKVEWEHVVPTENFGRAFSEWRNGHPSCVDSKGKPFNGRNCVSKVNMTYRRMQSDMHNLYPAIGAVNAMRSNMDFTELSRATPTSFGTCPAKISGNKFEPPEYTRGIIARTYKYMDAAYPQFNMSNQQKRLMDAWDNKYPVQKWECVKSKRIERIQGNPNPFVKEKCVRANLW
ncbi:MAG: endonuclease [Klebsiella quasipneumoniae]|nr:endonuclease [Klebsiella quasipneumoniae]